MEHVQTQILYPGQISGRPEEASPAAADLVLIVDISSGQLKRATVANLSAGVDHGGIGGLADDDHTQYSLADGTRWTATPTASRAVESDGSGNLVVSAVTSTELGYLSGVTSGIQTQIDGKAASSHSHSASDITSGTLAHEQGGLEADISGISTGDVIAGTGAGTLGLVTASGHSDGDVLTLQADGTADWETPAGGGGGLSHWTEANATPVANEVTSWTPSSASANVTVVLSPKGTGAVAADIADGTSAGGNDRGSNAIDLQSYRGAATEVASGQYSVVIGTECTASALGAVAIGRQNTASQTNATAVGYSNTVSGWYSTAFGQLNTVSGDNAVAAGRDNTADADHAIALGFKANTNGVEGKLAVAAGIITGSKPAQAGIYVLRRQTTDATLTELTSDNGAASTDNQIVLADDTVFAITAVVAGYDAAGTEQFGGRLFALFKRGTGAASVALVGAIMKDTIETDAGLDVTIAADTTNGAAAIKVTGKASTTIRWCATATVAEVG